MTTIRVSGLLFAVALMFALGACGEEPMQDDESDQSDTQEARLRFSTVQPFGPDPDSSADRRQARYPFVFVHGFNASPSVFGFHSTIVNAVRRDHARSAEQTRAYTLNVNGAQIEVSGSAMVANLPPVLSPDRVAERLRDQLEAYFTWLDQRGWHADKVNIIAHSMGGLDSRFLVAPNGLNYGRVESVTTVSTPHHGSQVANLLVETFDAAGSRGSGAIVNALNAVLRPIWRLPLGGNDNITDIRATLEAISEDRATQANNYAPGMAGRFADAQSFFENVEGNRDVTFYSWAGVSDAAPLLTGVNPNQRAACEPTQPNWLHMFATDRAENAMPDFMMAALVATARRVGHYGDNEPHDGLVMVNSARYANFMGCIPADHADEVGGFNGQTQQNTGFVPVRFYRNVAYDLAHRGH